MTTPIQPISGFRTFTKSEAVAIMEAKTARQSEIFERELRDMQDRMHTVVREIVKDQLALLASRIEQNTKDIQKVALERPASLETQEEIRTLVKTNQQNISQLDSNIKTIDQNIRELTAS